MKQNQKTKKPSFLSRLSRKQKIILAVILAGLILLLVFLLTSPSPTTPSTPSPSPTTPSTPSPSPIEFSYNTSDEWQQAYDQGLEEYEQQRNPNAEEFLSYLRQHTPLEQDNFTIDYSYKNNTYTITLLTTPYQQTKEEVSLWFQSQGVPFKIFNTLRLNWVEK